MKLEKLIDDLNQTLHEAMCEGSWDDDDFSAILITPSGQIEVFYYCKYGHWEAEVTIYHEHDYYRESPNLESYLADNIEVDWSAVEDSWRENEYDEWNDHGFRDEADFWHWKEGR